MGRWSARTSLIITLTASHAKQRKGNMPTRTSALIRASSTSAAKLGGHAACFPSCPSCSTSAAGDEGTLPVPFTTGEADMGGATPAACVSSVGLRTSSPGALAAPSSCPMATATFEMYMVVVEVGRLALPGSRLNCPNPNPNLKDSQSARARPYVFSPDHLLM